MPSPPPSLSCCDNLGVEAISHKREDSCQIHVGIYESEKCNFIVLNHRDLTIVTAAQPTQNI